jgi:hypothetical protein
MLPDTPTTYIYKSDGGNYNTSARSDQPSSDGDPGSNVARSASRSDGDNHNTSARSAKTSSAGDPTEC